jgi:hypothetical protein
MGMMEDAVSAIKATNVRRSALQAISLGTILSSLSLSLSVQELLALSGIR